MLMQVLTRLSKSERSCVELKEGQSTLYTKEGKREERRRERKRHYATHKALPSLPLKALLTSSSVGVWPDGREGKVGELARNRTRESSIAWAHDLGRTSQA